METQKEIHEEIIEHFKQKLGLCDSEAEDMFEWTEENNWANYDGIDRWIHLPTRKVISTQILYKIYANKCNK